jgi:hypothetical protein
MSHMRWIKIKAIKVVTSIVFCLLYDLIKEQPSQPAGSYMDSYYGLCELTAMLNS